MRPPVADAASDDVKSETVANVDGFNRALADSTIDKIVLSDDLSFTAPASGDAIVTIDRDVTIDLGGNTVTLAKGTDASSAKFGFLVSDGASVVIENGEITNTAADAFSKTGAPSVIKVSKSVLNLNNVDVTGVGDSTYAISIDGDAAAKETAATLNVNGGSIIAKGFASAVSTNGTYGNEVISINGSTLASDKGVAVYSPSDAVWTITETDITGVTGIDMRSGDITVTGGSITFNTAANDKTANSLNQGPLGLGVAVSVLDAGYNAEDIAISISDVDMNNKSFDKEINYDVIVSAFEYSDFNGTDNFVEKIFQSTNTQATTAPISVSYDGVEIAYADGASATASGVQVGTNGTVVTAGTTSDVSFTKDATATITQAEDSNVTIANNVKVTFTNESTVKSLILGANSGVTYDAEKNIDVTIVGSSTATVNGEKNESAEATASTFDELVAYLNAGVDKIAYNGSEITDNITVQAGTTLTISNDVSLAEGVVFTNNGTLNTSEKTIFTNGGSFVNNGAAVTAKFADMQNPENQIVITNLAGNFTVAEGCLTIDGTYTSSENGSVIEVRKGTLVISGTLNGELTIKNYGENNNLPVMFKDFVVNPGAVLTLDDNLVYTVESDVAGETGRFLLYGDLVPATNDDGSKKSVTITVDGDNVFTAFSGAQLNGNVAVTGTGKIDLAQAQNPQNVGEDISDDKTYGQLESVTIVDTLNIRNNSTVIVKGAFLVNENVTLTIEKGSKLIIDSSVASMIVNGNIVVEEGADLIVRNAKDVTVAGSIESEGTVDIGNQGTVNVTVKSGGSILIDDSTDSSVSVSGGLTIEAGGELTVKAQMTIGNITNQGTVTLNGAILTGSGSKISLAADGAVVDIVSVTGGYELQITDVGLKFPNYTETNKNDVKAGNENTVKFTCGDKTGVKGLTITESVTREDSVYYNNMSIAGSVATVDDRETTAGVPLNPENVSASITVSGPRLAVSGELILGARVTLTVDGAMSVSGTVTAVADDSFVKIGSSDNAKLTVTGLIQAVNEIKETQKLCATMYEQDVNNETNYFYTNFADAIASGADTVYVFGENKVDATMTVPANVTVRNEAGIIVVGADTDAGRDVVLTFTNGSSLRGGTVNVDGTLYFENKKDQRASDINSDVAIIGDVDARYTNIYTALGEAQPGQTVTITSDDVVVLKSNLTIPAGVTLDVPNSKYLALQDGVTLTVDGTLKTAHEVAAIDDAGEPSVFAAKASIKEGEEASAIIVNGTFMSNAEVQYDNYLISGAYYELVSSAGVYNYVTPLEIADDVAAQATEGMIEVYGTVSAGDVSFAGTVAQDVTVRIMNGATVTVTSIALSDAALTYETAALAADESRGVFTGTVTVGDASIEAVKLRMLTVTSDNGLTVANADVQLIEDGTTVAKLNAAAGTVIVQAVYGNMTVDAGASVSAPNTNAVKTGTVYGNMTVDGTLSIVKGTTMNVTGSVYVAGTVSVAAETDTDLPGTLDIDGKMYVGLSSKLATTATTASVTGPVAVDVVYAVSGATVSETTLEGLTETTAYNVEGAVWITAYMDPDMTVKASINDIKTAPVENAYFDGTWLDADGEIVTGVIGSEDVVYADVEYDIYVISILANQAVDDITIDGNLMYFSPIDNYYTATVDAGVHKIMYTLKNGYSGEGVLSCVYGDAAVSGLDFTASGTPEAGSIGYIYYSFQLTGFEKTGYVPESPDTGDSDSADTGMTITDYLLIVLVVLIIVMAIIVAMRLMRS